MKQLWEIWKYSLGSFSDDKTAPYDNYVALIRTSIFVSYMVTNAFIVSGVIRHWNNRPPDLPNQTISLYNYKVNKQSNVCHY
jgi:hypothetical protein